MQKAYDTFLAAGRRNLLRSYAFPWTSCLNLSPLSKAQQHEQCYLSEELSQSVIQIWDTEWEEGWHD